MNLGILTIPSTVELLLSFSFTSYSSLHSSTMELLKITGLIKLPNIDLFYLSSLS